MCFKLRVIKEVDILSKILILTFYNLGVLAIGFIHDGVDKLEAHHNCLHSVRGRRCPNNKNKGKQFCIIEGAMVEVTMAKVSMAKAEVSMAKAEVSMAKASTEVSMAKAPTEVSKLTVSIAEVFLHK